MVAKKNENVLADEPVGWVEAETSTVAEDLEGHLIAIRPIETHKEQGQFGENNVTTSEVWLLDADPVSMYSLDVPVRWQVVQRQLAKASPEAPWVVGTLELKGRAFVLTPPKPSDRQEINEAMAVISVMSAYAEEGGEEPF